VTNPGSGAHEASKPLEFDRLIHEPARLVLMANLYVVEEADFVYLARRTGLTAGNISSHMTRLEAAGYVTVSKTFAGKRPRTVYQLTGTGRAAFERYRQQVGGLLAEMP
jgi:DNA-binding MarR family transcriptional regulator